MMGDRVVLDAAVQVLVQRQAAWQAVTRPQRISYLQRCLVAVREISADWVTAAVAAKGGNPAAILPGEEWVAGPMATLLYLR
jgi:acyl-CoA reductase-like NAD-dependent aldehyde dehydrogenase